MSQLLVFNSSICIVPVLNMHELAMTSGFSAAYRLGAEYPFHGDEDCERLFRMYLGVSHGHRMVSNALDRSRSF